MFSVGDKIVYPMHGAGVIRKIEEREILGERRQYYVLKLPHSDMDVMIPIASEKTVGIREIIAKEFIEEVKNLLCRETSVMSSNWNRRYRENMEKLKTGDILEVAQVVRDLTRVEMRKGLSAGEKKLLMNSMQILVSELILAGDMCEEDAENLVKESVQLLEL